MSDLRYAIRMLAARPAFALVAVLTLSVGIGANTAIFSVVNGVLLRPLPYPEPDRIAQLWESTARAPRVRVSYPNFNDWHRRLTTFVALAAYQGGSTTVLGGAEPVFANVYAVTHDFFDVFGVQPAIGRTFTADEARPGGTPSVIVSHAFWERALRSTADLSTLHVEAEGITARVVGVMPEGFAYPARAEIWFPKEIVPDGSTRTGHNYSVVGRLGAPREQAAAQIAVVAAQLQAEHKGDNDAQSITMLSLQEAITGSTRGTLLLLLGAVGLVLLIACANVASTMFASGEERRAELAIRAALGASRGRLLRQLLVEGLLLGGAGATGGLLVAAWSVRAFLAMTSTPLPRREAIGMDGAVLAFTLGLAVLTPLLFGILPALQASRPDLRETIAEGGRAALSSVRGRVRDVLVAVEVAIALVLLIGSALLIRSFWNVMAVDTGFDAAGVISVELVAPPSKVKQLNDFFAEGRDVEAERTAAFYTQLLDRLRAVPGVAAVGAINSFPLTGSDYGGGFTFQGEDRAAGRARSAGYRVISADYFRTMKIPLLQGRSITDADRAGGEVAVVVNQDFVRQYVPDGHPLGRRFQYLGMDSLNEPMMTIVGIVANIHSASLVTGAAPEAYVSYLQRPKRTRGNMAIAIRPSRPGLAASLTPALRAAVSALDPDVPMRFATMEEVVGQSVADRRFMLSMLTAFAAIALLLAAVGIYSVLSQSVAQRTSEIGIRMALGADAAQVVRLMLRTAMRSVLAGAAIGVAGALAATRLLASFLFQIRPLDPAAFASAAAVLIAVALAAAYVPARRATRVDPLIALRVQ